MKISGDVKRRPPAISVSKYRGEIFTWQDLQRPTCTIKETIGMSCSGVRIVWQCGQADLRDHQFRLIGTDNAVTFKNDAMDEPRMNISTIWNISE